MSAEERWADRQQWRRDRGEVEIKICRKLAAGYACVAQGCDRPAVSEYEIGEVAYPSGILIDVCPDHDDEETAFDIYGRLMGASR